MSADRVRVGIVGGGLMGREIAVALQRWPALLDHPVVPELTAVCDINPAALQWFDRIPTVRHRVMDHHELLALDDVDVVYIAVRHDLHEALYRDAIEAGKDLLAEKPFGIDLGAATRLVELIDATGRFVRVSSEMPFFPGAQQAIEVAKQGALGTIIEASNQLRHSSDLDPSKPINWKRINATCGEAGVMNDLGMHSLHVPLRLGWEPHDVFAILQNIIPERPDGSGGTAVCETWDNASLTGVVRAEIPFPLAIGMKRLDPGQQNSWDLRIVGTLGGVEFTTRNPNLLRRVVVGGAQQSWTLIETGSQSVFPTVTGGIFEFGFSDAILQMLAAFFAERAGVLGDRFGCARPEEALATHRIFAAALRSQDSLRAEPVR